MGSKNCRRNRWPSFRIPGLSSDFKDLHGLIRQPASLLQKPMWRETANANSLDQSKKLEILRDTTHLVVDTRSKDGGLVAQAFMSRMTDDTFANFLEDIRCFQRFGDAFDSSLP